METWKPIAEAPGYAISDLGRVRGPRGNILKPQRNGPYQYQKVSLGRGKQRYVHRLVAAAFLGSLEGLEVEHVNGDPANNTVANLLIVTHAENMRRQRLRKPDCQRGHAFAVYGGWSPSTGRRYCRECARQREKRRVRRRSRREVAA